LRYLSRFSPIGIQEVTSTPKYYYEKYESRKKDNNLGASLRRTANGEYNTDAHIVGGSVSYEF
jgi:hypothetical protein